MRERSELSTQRPAPAVLLSLVLLAALFLVGCSTTAEAAERAVVRDVEGQVEWRAENEEAWTSAEEGVELAPGAVIRTGVDGRLRLVFDEEGPDADEIYLAPGTELRIVRVVLDEAGEVAEIVLEQVRGRARHVVTAGDGVTRPVIYSVTSAHGEAATSDGTFTLNADAGSATRLAVDSGLVYGTAGDASYPVSAGRALALRTDEPPQMAHFVVYGAGPLVRNGDLWAIGGRDFLVTADTVVEGELTDGAYAYVEGHVREDGTLVADVISGEPLDETDIVPADDDSALLSDSADEEDAACVVVNGVVESWDGQTLILVHGTRVQADELDEIEGDVERFSTVRIRSCMEDGERVSRLVVLEAAPEDVEDGERVTLCHVPPGNPDNQHTIAVDADDVGDHLAHGDYLGACDPELLDDVDEDVDAELLEDEDDEGDEHVTLCHVPPGNPANEQTITVGESAVDAHLGHGDYLGECDGRSVDEDNRPGRGRGRGND